MQLEDIFMVRRIMIKYISINLSSLLIMVSLLSVFSRMLLLILCFSQFKVSILQNQLSLVPQMNFFNGHFHLLKQYPLIYKKKKKLTKQRLHFKESVKERKIWPFLGNIDSYGLHNGYGICHGFKKDPSGSFQMIKNFEYVQHKNS